MKYLKLSDLRKASWYDVFGAEVEVWWHYHMGERTWCKLTTWLTAPLRPQTKLLWGITCSQWSAEELSELLDIIIGDGMGVQLFFINGREQMTRSSTWNELLTWANEQTYQKHDPHRAFDQVMGNLCGQVTQFLREKAQKRAKKRKLVDFHPTPWQAYLSFMEVPLPKAPARSTDTELGLNPVLATRARQWFATGHRHRPLQYSAENHTNPPPPRGNIGGWTLQGRPISPNIPRTSRPSKRATGHPSAAHQLGRFAGLRIVHKLSDFHATSRKNAVSSASPAKLATEGRA